MMAAWPIMFDRKQMDVCSQSFQIDLGRTNAHVWNHGNLPNSHIQLQKLIDSMLKRKKEILNDSFKENAKKANFYPNSFLEAR